MIGPERHHVEQKEVKLEPASGSSGPKEERGGGGFLGFVQSLPGNPSGEAGAECRGMASAAESGFHGAVGSQALCNGGDQFMMRHLP